MRAVSDLWLSKTYYFDQREGPPAHSWSQGWVEGALESAQRVVDFLAA